MTPRRGKNDIGSYTSLSSEDTVSSTLIETPKNAGRLVLNIINVIKRRYEFTNRDEENSTVEIAESIT